MRIAGGSSYIPRLSANQLIGTATRTRNSSPAHRVNSVSPQQPTEELEALKSNTVGRTTVKRNVGPSLAELTPQPSAQRPQGFFSNEETKSEDSEELVQSAQNKQKSDELENKPTNDSHSNSEDLTEEEQQEVSKLKARDAEVVAHEQAHKAVAGSLSPGPIHYDYTRGPD